MKTHLIICSLAIFLLATSPCKAQTSPEKTNHQIINESQRSHVDGNIPDAQIFDSLLTSDLEKFFTPLYGSQTMHWEFLREGPTQSGVSYPKFYLWVNLNNKGKLVSEGAVRVEAIDKIRFNVTDYVDINQIKKKSKDIHMIFPGPVCDKIEAKIN